MKEFENLVNFFFLIIVGGEGGDSDNLFYLLNKSFFISYSFKVILLK